MDTTLHIPPFTVRLQSPFPDVEQHLARFYGRYDRAADGCFVDFHVRLVPGEWIHRVWRPQVRFLVDDQNPFIPLPADQAAPMFEWGLNWTVASRSLGLSVLHAAVLGKGDDAIILPGFPGAGKSTLCASLALLEGWRLFSDELAILDPATGWLLPHPRPISLKNQSIDIVAAFPGAHIGPRFEDTRKGTVAHAAVPDASVVQASKPGRPRWLVFPRFEAGAATSVVEIPKAEAFALIQQQSFNRDRLGDVGFDTLGRMLSDVRCYATVYGSTSGGIEGIQRIVSDS
ncbi:MAG: HprK-related kinase A [Rhodocyclaceae bacterium]|nr:HprK-related kinase A [Rhodocyclaceae bacterium]